MSLKSEIIKSALRYADTIQELGYGGKSIKNYLIEYARGVKSGQAIIDIGPYMGSTTAYLAIGVMQSGHDVEINSFDKFIMYPDMRRKANDFNGIEFKDNECFIDLYKYNIKPFDEYVFVRKCDCLDIEWNGGEVGLLVDDISNGKDRTDHLFKTFSQSFIKNETFIFLMDYYYHESFKNKFRYCKYANDFMVKNSSVFQFVKRIEGSRTAIFKYKGGEINYDVKGESYTGKEYEKKGR